jgi:hypothetical protein
MKTLEYAVSNINGTVESETIFVIEGEIPSKKMDKIYVDKLGRKFIHYYKNTEKKVTNNINPVHVLKTFVHNTDDIFKRINLN